MPPPKSASSKQRPDFYAILEIEKAATTSDVRKAYRKLALRWHPDKNPEQQEFATKKFKEISEAYEVLSDEKKRQIYEQGPTEEHHHRRHSRHHKHSHNNSQDSDDDQFDGLFHFPHFVFRDPTEIFREFFGGTDPFEDMMVGLLGGHHHRVIRNRHRAFHNRIHLNPHIHHNTNASAEAAGSGGSGHRNARHQHNSRVRGLQPSNPAISTIDPFNHIGGGLSLFGSMGNSLSPFSRLSPFGSLLGGGIQDMFGGINNVFGDNQSFVQTSFSTSGDGIRSTSSNTRIVNGQKITTTRRTMSDGTTTQETVCQNIPLQQRQGPESINRDIITID